MALDANDRLEIARAIEKSMGESLKSIFSPTSSRGRVGGGADKDKAAETAQKKAVVASTTQLGKLSDNTAQANKALSSFSKRLESVDKIIQDLTKNLTKNKSQNTIKSDKKPQVIEFDFSKLTKTTGEVTQSLVGLSSASGLLSNRFDGLKKSIEGVSEQIKGFGDSLDQSRQRSSVQTLVPSFSGLDDFAKKIANSVNPGIDSLGNNLTGVSRVLNTIFNELATTAPITGFTDANNLISNKVNPALENLSDTAKKSRSSLLLFNRTIASSTAVLASVASTPNASLTSLNAVIGKVNPRLVNFKNQLSQASIALRSFRSGLGGGRSGGGGNEPPGNEPPDNDPNLPKKNASEAADNFKAGLKKYAYEIFGVFKEFVDDAYQVLAARGYGTLDSMKELYKDAALAGMSLREYAQFMDKNMIVVSRASSFADFQSQLKQGTDGLKQFGVFGQDAVNMAGTMMSTAVGMGVPQAKLNDAIKAQTEAFAELRKGSNLTAEAFSQLITTIQEDEQLNRELANLSVNERMARTKDIAIGLGYAKQLGLSTSAQQAYTQSVLEHRKTTVKQRFEQAGRLTQVGAMVGMSAEETDRMRRLAKNKYRTAEEDKEFALLAGKLNSGLEKMQQEGPGSQFQSDVAREKLEQAGLGSALAAGTQIKAAIEAGPTKNKDLNKTLSSDAQFIGGAITTLTGIMKNPLAELVTMAGAQLASSITSNVLLGIIAKNGVGGSLGGLGSSLGKVGKVAKIGGAAVAVGYTAYEGYSAYKNYNKAQEDESNGVAGAKEAKSGAKGTGYGMAAGAAIGVAAAAAVAAVTGGVGLTAATAIVSGMTSLGGYIGGLIGATVGAETASEKYARELKNNTKVTEQNTRSLAGSSSIDSSNIKNLGAIVNQSTMAYTAKTAEENKKAFDSTAEGSAALKAMQEEQIKALTTAKDSFGKNVYGLTVSDLTTPSGKLKSNLIDSSGGIKADLLDATTGNLNIEAIKKELKNTSVPKESSSKDTVKAQPVVTVTPNVEKSIGTVATPAASTNTNVTPPPIAVSTIGSNDQKANINKTAEEEVKHKEKTETTLQQNPIADASQILLQILEVLKNSLTAETLQAQLTEQLIRANALRPTLPDNQDLARRLYAQV